MFGTETDWEMNRSSSFLPITFLSMYELTNKPLTGDFLHPSCHTANFVFHESMNCRQAVNFDRTAPGRLSDQPVLRNRRNHLPVWRDYPVRYAIRCWLCADWMHPERNPLGFLEHGHKCPRNFKHTCTHTHSQSSRGLLGKQKRKNKSVYQNNATLST